MSSQEAARRERQREQSLLLSPRPRSLTGLIRTLDVGSSRFGCSAFKMGFSKTTNSGTVLSYAISSERDWFA